MILFAIAAAALQAPAEPVVIVSPAETALDPAAVAEAMQLLDDEEFEDQLMRSSALSVEAMFAVTASNIQKQSGEPLPEDFLKELRKTLLEHSESTLRANMRSIKGQAAAIYAQEFTRHELARLRQIASDPVMVKARERMKAMEPKFMALGIQVMQKSEPELEAKIARLVAEYLANQPKARNDT